MQERASLKMSRAGTESHLLFGKTQVGLSPLVQSSFLSPHPCLQKTLQNHHTALLPPPPPSPRMLCTSMTVKPESKCQATGQAFNEITDHTFFLLSSSSLCLCMGTPFKLYTLLPSAQSRQSARSHDIPGREFCP